MCASSLRKFTKQNVAQVMATGYDDNRFETKVDENLHCIICTEVLKDPVQCRRNEHRFCRNCITEHLKNSPKCPTCNDPLTVETLAKPQRFLANTLSCLKISCDNSERGCREVVELGSLATHVASCGFSPMPCSNDQCKEIISRRDKEIHENKVCDFRLVKCDYCGQMVLYKNFMQYTMRNTPQRSGGSHASSGQEMQAEIVVAGGNDHKSVEVFNMATKTWRRLSNMKERRYGATSVLYQGRMILTGGLSQSYQYLASVEELNLAQQDGHWVQSQFEIPAPSRDHACVVYQNKLFVIGGWAPGWVYDTIHEIQLTPRYTSRLLTKMPRPICFHGAEIVSGKIFIIGGSTTTFCDDATNTVLMFDPVTNTCTELKPLPYAVSSMATATWKDNVVVVGGMDKEGNTRNTVILYNVTTGNHRMLPEMRKKRFGCTAVTIGDNIIAIGGCDEIVKSLNSVECYNFNSNTWTEFPAMAEARYYPTAVVKYC